VAGTPRKTAADLLVDARSVIRRVDPETAWAASGPGEALIVDIRSDDERRRDGIVPGSLHLPRTVLEWRVDPESGWSNRHAVETERRLILLCAHGSVSSTSSRGMALPTEARRTSLADRDGDGLRLTD
jgi:rhodanese-related sulfurtransferase